jgi:ligand-binding SRPBCC domain-containing protein
MAQFDTSVAVRAPLEKIFDLFLKPSTIVRLSPPKLGMVLIRGPEELAPGTELEFKVQAWGQVISSVHEIIQVERPRIIVERQIKGPFRNWEHEHLFSMNDAGDVVVADRISFAPPGGLIGLLVTESKILDELENGYDHRHKQLLKLVHEFPGETA